MDTEKKYAAAIIGGGLAGLAASIELARSGHSVILFEKEKYPFHKVCGEYVSMESRNYLCSLGLKLNEMDLPRINRFELTSPSGKKFSTKLDPGGFGISRYLLDSSLATIAKNEGVMIFEETKVTGVEFHGNNFSITAISPTGKYQIQSSVCLSAFGKKSNLDIKWKRNFLNIYDKRLDNYLAVKYHVHLDWDYDKIALHNFQNGYCGISKIEGHRYCLCYLVRAEELQRSGNDIAAMEKNILSQNPHLKKLFSTCVIAEGFPVTISQVNFNKKTSVENHVIMTGDAAGLITPLCGNGMSIALHTAKIASRLANNFLRSEITRTEMEENYNEQWKKLFSRRLATGRVLQKFFGSNNLTNSFVKLVKIFPFLAKPLIRKTHGKAF
jgi:menaquinone-9 beta-reductase